MIDRRLVDEELGPLRLCPRCGDWWPDDREFFSQSAVVCIACTDELRNRARYANRERVRRFRERQRGSR